MAKANQQFRTYVVHDLTELNPLLQADLTTMDGWKITQMDINIQPGYVLAWAIFEHTL